ncbi:MAG: PAS domain-containing sensor histidine kinase [Prevotella sp.]|nr:PAS domain-containing sensor histidine kinase [Prevotella sp.]
MLHSLLAVLIAQVTQIGKVYDFDHTLAYVVAFLLIGVFVLIFYNRLYVFQRQEVNASRRSQNARLALILKAGKQRIWIYTPAKRHYSYLSDEGTYEEEYNPVEFSQRFDRDDFELMRQAIFDVADEKRSSAVVTVKSNAEDDEARLYYEINVSVASRDQHGHPTRLLGIERDITDKIRKQEQVNKLLMRYHTVFNSSLLDMIYYDKNGVLQDINEKACQAFGVADRDQIISEGFLLQNNPFFSGIELEQMENTRTSSIVDFGQFTDEIYQTERFGLKGKMYYDSTINPFRNAQGELEGVYMCGRDITEMVESVHRQREGALRLQQATKNVQNYISNINYALRVSGVRFVSYHPQSYTLEVSDNINETQLRLSQLRCIRLATFRFRRNVSSMLNRMDRLSKYTIAETIETEFRDKKGRQVWLMFNMVPIIDKEGNVERYFGVMRDMTDMVETERRLAVETKKAQETELLKQSFLTNMSYEIRTPLNNVVGFAELFESEHEEADEQLFVEEIKKSSNTLLLLINDILFLSRLDANMIEYNKADVDFAMVFESHCQMGWSSMSPAVRTVVDNPYERLVVDIDEANLGKVIEKLCQLSAYFTREGTVSARCEYRRGELTISIEDTGIGIDAQTLPHVFDRFVRDQREELCGTGLDLPIVQSLVQQMGGSIEMESELGKGTTVWVSIPCEAKVIAKRRVTQNMES